MATFNSMRLAQPNRRFLSVVAYSAAVATVLIGMPYGLGLALSTVDQPSFLVPEHENRFVVSDSSAPPEIPVLLKPYVAPTRSQASWGASIGRSYVARSKPEAQGKAAATEAKRNTKSKKRAPHRATRKQTTMDAYASGRARDRY
jgi:hypothetical protein